MRTTCTFEGFFYLITVFDLFLKNRFPIKEIMKSLMELSASLDTYRPNSQTLFRNASANSKTELIDDDGKF